MTQHSTSEIAGQDGGPISTGLSKALSPEQFATACQQIVQTQSGDAAHRALDQLVTNLLSSLGYGEGMAVFINAVKPCHDAPAFIAAYLDSLAERTRQRGMARAFRIAADGVRAGLYLEEKARG